VSHEFEDFATESARAARRDRARRGPKVVMDNPGLRTLTAQLATNLKTRNARRTLNSPLGDK
jgi:hypothetical protein